MLYLVLIISNGQMQRLEEGGEVLEKYPSVKSGQHSHEIYSIQSKSRPPDGGQEVDSTKEEKMDTEMTRMGQARPALT